MLNYVNDHVNIYIRPTTGGKVKIGDNALVVIDIDGEDEPFIIECPIIALMIEDSYREEIDLQRDDVEMIGIDLEIADSRFLFCRDSLSGYIHPDQYGEVSGIMYSVEDWEEVMQVEWDECERNRADITEDLALEQKSNGISKKKPDEIFYVFAEAADDVLRSDAGC